MRNIKNIKTGKDYSSLSKLTTPTDLADKARIDISKNVNPLIADIFALYVKTKNFHWHMSGPHYRDYHLLFDEHAEQLFAMIDILAERIRKLGGTTIRSIGHINQLTKVKDDDEEFVDAKEMVKRLLNDNKQLLANMRHIHKICSDHKDVATTSLLEVFIDETERRTWFLFEIQTD